ncbi:hypothetical protein BCR37DRAFT_376197 [Protomyces lactucae-debilis]|uniref:Uncharacterized protein n=1 Tax=Protomyces lactucae-debilis TaxID=2754530 RepID=A0A1Y2FSC1_PROLT|nr:uncharacterized protein BCR37DRAFT_376197 [Protomyces lactucae-debilis]ORY86912.1 hypothetical protein BCR37DRAFT_376197 [Protomyces lactucae-debilis]
MQLQLVFALALASVSAVDFHGVDISATCADGINSSIDQGQKLVPTLDELTAAGKGTPNEKETTEIADLAHTSLDLYNKYKDRSIATGVTQDEKDAAQATFSRFGKARSDMEDMRQKTDLDPTVKAVLEKYNKQRADLLSQRTPLLFKCATSMPALKAGYDKVLNVPAAAA